MPDAPPVMAATLVMIRPVSCDAGAVGIGPSRYAEILPEIKQPLSLGSRRAHSDHAPSRGRDQVFGWRGRLGEFPRECGRRRDARLARVPAMRGDPPRA